MNLEEVSYACLYTAVNYDFTPQILGPKLMKCAGKHSEKRGGRGRNSRNSNIKPQVQGLMDPERAPQVFIHA